MNPPKTAFKSFSDFYPFYISEHSNKISKIVHFVGTGGIFILLAATLITKNLNFLWLVPLSGY